ncbi:hypothetical protein [Pectobacterium sp. CHL-2024]|uniref:hypothetical protein n=1 Tax=Pectobacterium sp. CHL-2024 TaxID=3377079 RepID=UPI0038102728
MNQHPTKETKAHMHDCYYREHMTARLKKTTFNTASFIQVILGSTVMADVMNSWLLGFFIMILSAYLFVFKPGEASGIARQQSFEYEKIIHRSNSMSEDEIKTALIDLAEHDSDIPGNLVKPAYIRSLIAAGYSADRIDKEISTLTRCERFFAFISGGIPR